MNFIEGEEREHWEARFTAGNSPEDTVLTMWLEKDPDSGTPSGFVVRIASDEILAEVQAAALAEGVDLETYLGRMLAKKLRDRGKPAVPKRKPPRSPNPSDGGDSMPMVTAPIPHFWGQALTAGGPNAGRMERGWEKNTVNQHPQFARTRITSKGGEATVYFDAKGYSALELWGKVYSIDELVLETYCVILALMSDSRNACPPGYVKRFYINPAQILELKGFRRWGEDRRVALRRVIDAIKLLSEWTTDYSGFPLPPDKKGKPRFAEQRGCKIFHVLSSWHAGEQGELFENEQGDLEHAPLSIHCVSGDWLAHWMNEDGGYFWVQSIPRKVLEIPGTNEAQRLAKRIGMSILGFVAGTDHINKEICWTVRKILEDLVMLPTEEYRGLGGREGKGERMNTGRTVQTRRCSVISRTKWMRTGMKFTNPARLTFWCPITF